MFAMLRVRLQERRARDVSKHPAAATTSGTNKPAGYWSGIADVVVHSTYDSDRLSLPRIRSLYSRKEDEAARMQMSNTRSGLEVSHAGATKRSRPGT